MSADVTTPTTFDPANSLSSSIAFSNGNLTVANSVSTDWSFGAWYQVAK